MTSTDKLEIGDLEIDIFKMMHIDRSFAVMMVDHLKKDYFESIILGKVFAIYQSFFQKHNKLPNRNVVESITEGLGIDKKKTDIYFNQIFIPKEEIDIDAAEKDYVTEEVVKFAKRARMVEAINESINLIEQDDFDKIVSLMKDALIFNLDINIGFDLYDVDARYAKIAESIENKVTTGYGQLDRVLGGGWAKRELYCVMGPPGFGKSIFLPNFGIKALLNGMNVVHYTLEMSEERLGMRYDAISTGLIMKELNAHPDEIKKKYDTIKKITKSRLKMKEFPTGMASVMDIESHLENLKLHEDFVPDLLIVDYGDIMRSSHKAANLYEEQGWIFRELRGLAVKKDVVVITATQSNRDSLGNDGATKEIIGMHNTADSMEKNRIIDVLFTITQTKSEKDGGQINLYTAKNRNGESNVYAQFNINYGNMQLKEPLLGNNNQNNASNTNTA